jgi:diaminopimelate decarboxylase/aspartate kinase
LEHWSVLKFGGTSVACAAHWKTIAELAGQRLSQGRRVVVVCSALAGVTNRLQALADGEPDAEPLIAAIIAQHAALARESGVDAAADLDAGRTEIEEAYARYRQQPNPAGLALLLGQGELLSSRLGSRILARQLDAGWVDARTALTSLPEPRPDSRRAWLSARCAATPDGGLAERWSRLPAVLVTQGFIAAAPGGATVLLGRGGSDTSAALLAAGLQAPSVEIWTDVPGLFTCDPRLEPSARLIGELDYAEALELAASGARVVHPSAIRAAAEARVSVQVRDIARPDLAGTVIGADAMQTVPGIKAVTCQRDMLVLLLENLDMRQQVGFLAGVFAAVSEAGVSVDLVATSETTTTLAINARANHLDAAATEALVTALAAHCRVQAFPGCSCVNLVGRGARTALLHMGGAARVFEQRPLLMLSQSANDLSISLLVPGEDAPALQAALHRDLIVGTDAERMKLGPSWQSLQAGQ